ncbi:AAA family ATPase [Vibrio campbellii]|uniref:AAA family ATPase n=1 Tax=Vibrio campbellii TaxID=680 RepID=UPI0015C458B6|nr:AAA family ATPase [Vibrio campbellii]
MREAKIRDYWSRINRFKKYNNIPVNLSLSSAGRYHSSNIEINSAITAICGRNGLGKTTLLKLLYKALSKDNDFDIPNTIHEEVESIDFSIKRNGNLLNILGGDTKIMPNVEYFDGAHLLHIVNREILDSPSKNGWTNGSTKLDLVEEDLDVIKLITGKKYISFEVWEVSDIIEDTVFPYFEVELDGNRYSNEGMGQGEHKLLLIWWKMFSSKKNAFLLLEEPEAYVCPSSQKKMMDMIAFYASKNSINIIMTTHSEHILSKLNVGSVNILKRKGRDKFELVPASNNTRYFVALGLNSEYKNIFLVEDDFAKLTLEIILKKYDEHTYKTSVIHSLRGESNIQMVTKHYQGASHFNYVAVYDADQRGVTEDFSPYIEKVYLPSSSNAAPEFEVIDYIQSNTGKYASRINMDIDVVEEVIAEMVADHHDWFKSLSAGLDKNQNIITTEAIQLWVDNNEELCRYFIFELNNLSNEIKLKLTDEKNLITECGLTYQPQIPISEGLNKESELLGKLCYQEDNTVVKLL